MATDNKKAGLIAKIAANEAKKKRLLEKASAMAKDVNRLDGNIKTLTEQLKELDAEK